jgi:hypothetical protein
VRVEASTEPPIHNLIHEFLINMAFTMAYPNFKKDLKMTSGPLGVKYQTKEPLFEKLKKHTRIYVDIPICFCKASISYVPYSPLLISIKILATIIASSSATISFDNLFFSKILILLTSTSSFV